MPEMCNATIPQLVVNMSLAETITNVFEFKTCCFSVKRLGEFDILMLHFRNPVSEKNRPRESEPKLRPQRRDARRCGLLRL